MPAAQIAFDFGPSQVRAPSPLRRAIDEAKRAQRDPKWESQVGLTAAPARVPASVTETATGSLLSPRAPQTVDPRTADPRTADPKAALEQLLRSALDMPVRLSLTDNRRTMISLRKGPHFTEARLHHMFLRADAATRAALHAYVQRGDRAASVLLGTFIDSQRERIRMRARRAPSLRESSVHHDLLQIYAEVNATYFDGKVDARISWGRDTQVKAGKRRRSIKLGSYCSRERLIRVHPGLDAEFVPRFFVEYIVFHEMLHHVVPAVIKGGRRELHGREFKRRERLFARYDEALRWERQNLDRLLRA